MPVNMRLRDIMTVSPHGCTAANAPALLSLGAASVTIGSQIYERGFHDRQTIWSFLNIC